MRIKNGSDTISISPDVTASGVHTPSEMNASPCRPSQGANGHGPKSAGHTPSRTGRARISPPITLEIRFENDRRSLNGSALEGPRLGQRDEPVRDGND